jgi:mono/diheme cytochrome c family protein
MFKTLRWKSMLAGALALLVLLVAIAMIVVLTGAYNVAATDRHETTVAWALETTRIKSVQGQAADVEAPAALTAAMATAGAGEYKTMCEHCHGGVGKDAASWSVGMAPNAPPLAKVAGEWTPEEVFWMVKHGLKMTGMPAFGPTHDDATMWNITAFVKALPEMSAEEYAAYPAVHGAPEEGGHSHAAGTPAHQD